MTRRRGSITGNKADGFMFCLDIAPGGGSRKRMRRSGFRTRADAQDALNEVLGHQTEGRFVQPHKERVAGFLEDWLTTIEPTVRPSTHASYCQKVRLHVLPHLGHMRLQQVDAMTLNRLYADLLADGRKDGAGGRAPRTVHYIHTILHRAYKDARRWGRLQHSPVDDAEPPRNTTTGRSIQRTWTSEDVGTFLATSTAADDRYLPLWALLATTGMRRGEALGLRWADLNLTTGVASVVQTIVCVEHAVLFSQPKTASGARSIDLDAETMNLLRRHKVRQTEARLKAGSQWTDHDLIFTKPNGTPLHPERVSREFKRRIDRINSDAQALPAISLHGLRHTWATLAMKDGINPKVVQERLGHSRISITLELYSHVSPGMQRQAADLIAGQIYAVGHKTGTDSASAGRK